MHEIRKNNRATGSHYEAKAADFLIKQGYQILEQNFHSRHGEIDLIAKEGETLVFIEVKYRKDEASGDPAEAVDRKKQKHLIYAARFYLLTHGYSEDMACRFDVVSILGNEFRLYQDAFWT